MKKQRSGTRGQKFVSRTALVRSELILRGITLKRLAVKAGVTPRMLAYVLQGERQSARVQRVVAKTLGMSFEELWGRPAPAPEKDQEASCAG